MPASSPMLSIEEDREGDVGHALEKVLVSRGVKVHEARNDGE